MPIGLLNGSRSMNKGGGNYLQQQQQNRKMQHQLLLLPNESSSSYNPMPSLPLPHPLTTSDIFLSKANAATNGNSNIINLNNFDSLFQIVNDNNNNNNNSTIHQQHHQTLSEQQHQPFYLNIESSPSNTKANNGLILSNSNNQSASYFNGNGATVATTANKIILNDSNNNNANNSRPVLFVLLTQNDLNSLTKQQTQHQPPHQSQNIQELKHQQFKQNEILFNDNSSTSPSPLLLIDNSKPPVLNKENNKKNNLQLNVLNIYQQKQAQTVSNIHHETSLPSSPQTSQILTTKSSRSNIDTAIDAVLAKVNEGTDENDNEEEQEYNNKKNSNSSNNNEKSVSNTNLIITSNTKASHQEASDIISSLINSSLQQQQQQLDSSKSNKARTSYISSLIANREKKPPSYSSNNSVLSDEIGLNNELNQQQQKKVSQNILSILANVSSQNLVKNNVSNGNNGIISPNPLLSRSNKSQNSKSIISSKASTKQKNEDETTPKRIDFVVLNGKQQQQQQQLNLHSIKPKSSKIKNNKKNKNKINNKNNKSNNIVNTSEINSFGDCTYLKRLLLAPEPARLALATAAATDSLAASVHEALLETTFDNQLVTVLIEQKSVEQQISVKKSVSKKKKSANAAISKDSCTQDILSSINAVAEAAASMSDDGRGENENANVDCSVVKKRPTKRKTIGSQQLKTIDNQQASSLLDMLSTSGSESQLNTASQNRPKKLKTIADMVKHNNSNVMVPAANHFISNQNGNVIPATVSDIGIMERTNSNHELTINWINHQQSNNNNNVSNENGLDLMSVDMSHGDECLQQFVHDNGTKEATNLSELKFKLKKEEYIN